MNTVQAYAEALAHPLANTIIGCVGGGIAVAVLGYAVYMLVQAQLAVRYSREQRYQILADPLFLPGVPYGMTREEAAEWVKNGETK